jgi:enoyl-CoA hydratase
MLIFDWRDAEGIMTYENILLEKKNSIAYVTVNRPKVLNALNMATMEELRAAFHDIKNDDSIRVVILTGRARRRLLPGADIGELAQQDAVSGKEVCASRAERAQSDRESGQAGDCLHQRIRARRRMRTGARLHHASRERQREARAAGGEAGDYSGIWRTQRLPRLVGKGIAMQMVLAER